MTSGSFFIICKSPFSFNAIYSLNPARYYSLSLSVTNRTTCTAPFLNIRIIEISIKQNLLFFSTSLHQFHKISTVFFIRGVPFGTCRSTIISKSDKYITLCLYSGQSLCHTLVQYIQWLKKHDYSSLFHT